uniref:Uncharacterized protein n=1 Tax=Anguilla anguilla TaxID=7936 RepID=A0A0E9UCW8_ANGAN
MKQKVTGIPTLEEPHKT